MAHDGIPLEEMVILHFYKDEQATKEEMKRTFSCCKDSDCTFFIILPLSNCQKPVTENDWQAI